MERTTNRELDSLLLLWTRAVNGKVAKHYNDVQGYHFEHAYGQPRLVKVETMSGGVSDISPRLSKGDMARWLRAGISAIEQREDNTNE